MIKIITPAQFKRIPWKNGLGETLELAINAGATLDNFDWRISMASVTQDGVFSDFSGYQRNLILTEGIGITLQHEQNGQTWFDHLDQSLSVATFDGGCTTTGILTSGPITDFNVITHATKYQVSVATSTEQDRVKLDPCHLCFIYTLLDDAVLSEAGDEAGDSVKQLLPGGHLLQLEGLSHERLSVSGKGLIVVRLICSD